MDDSTALIVGIVSGIAFVIGRIAESALFSYSHSKLERTLSEERFAEISRALKDDDIHLVSLAIFNAFALIVLAASAVAHSAFGGATIGNAALFATVIVLIPVGFVHVVVQRAAENALLATLGFTVSVSRLLRPLTAILDGIGRIFGRGIGGTEPPSDEEDAVEEILDAVSEGEAEGVLEGDAADYIENIMDSRDRIAREIMTPRPSLLCAQLDMTFDEVLDTLSEGHSRVPVFRDNRDDIVGFSTSKTSCSS